VREWRLGASPIPFNSGGDEGGKITLLTEPNELYCRCSSFHEAKKECFQNRVKPRNFPLAPSALAKIHCTCTFGAKMRRNGDRGIFTRTLPKSIESTGTKPFLG